MTFASIFNIYFGELASWQKENHSMLKKNQELFYLRTSSTLKSELNVPVTARRVRELLSKMDGTMRGCLLCFSCGNDLLQMDSDENNQMNISFLLSKYFPNYFEVSSTSKLDQMK